jgi:hypothetical protein
MGRAGDHLHCVASQYGAGCRGRWRPDKFWQHYRAYRQAVGVCRPHPQRREAGLLSGLTDDDQQALITARPFGGTLVAKGVTIPWKDSVSHFLLSDCFHDASGVP